MFIRKHTVNTGGKKVAVKRQGQKVVLTLLGLYITQDTLNVSIDCVLLSAWLLQFLENIKNESLKFFWTRNIFTSRY